MKIEDVVVRTLGEELDHDIRATLPLIRRIDFQRLQGFEVPPLKVLQDFIIKTEINLDGLSTLPRTVRATAAHHRAALVASTPTQRSRDDHPAYGCGCGTGR